MTDCGCGALAQDGRYCKEHTPKKPDDLRERVAEFLDLCDTFAAGSDCHCGNRDRHEDGCAIDRFERETSGVRAALLEQPEPVARELEGRTIHNAPCPGLGDELGVWLSAEAWSSLVSRPPVTTEHRQIIDHAEESMHYAARAEPEGEAWYPAERCERCGPLRCDSCGAIHEPEGERIEGFAYRHFEEWKFYESEGSGYRDDFRAILIILPTDTGESE